MASDSVALVTVTFLSFGHKHSVPETDHNFSVRHFDNPSKKARDAGDGRTTRLQAEIFSHPNFEENYAKLCAEITEYIKNLDKSKNCLTIGIGCEHGKDRSPALCYKLAKDFGKSKQFSTAVAHHDINYVKREIKRKKEYDKRRSEKRAPEEED